MNKLVAEIRAEQRAEWLAGRRVPIETLLDRHPALKDDDEAIVDAIYGEILLHEELREPVNLEDYLQRFQKYADQLRRQLLLDEMVRDLADSQATVPEPSSNGGGQETVQIEHPGSPSFPTVPGYEIQSVLGEGSHGIVYLARQLSLDKLVALKMLRDGDLARPEDRKLLRRDAEVLAKLEHPSIVRIIDFGEAGGRSFYSMEYVKGRSLEDRLEAGPLPPHDAAQLVETLARALQAVHDKGIVHRDLKPANILLDENGTPKVADFGLAKRLGADVSLAASGQLVGNLAHMAPEQVEGNSNAVGPETDIWALGVILYESLTGRLPFVGQTVLEMMAHIRSAEPGFLRSDRIDRDLQTICLKCLEKDPARRFTSAAELSADLERRLADEPIVSRPRRQIERLWGRVRRRRAAVVGWTISAIAVLASLGIVYAALNAPSPDQLETKRQIKVQERISENLRAGRSVEFIGLTGGPEAPQWITQNPTSKSFLGEDGSFAIESWGHALLELQADPQRDHYRLRAEVRQDHGSFRNGSVGIYFLRQDHEGSKGLEQCYCLLAFNDLDLTGHGKNPIQQTVQLTRESTSSTYRDDFGTVDFDPALTRSGAGPWRPLAVEVEPHRVRFYWEDMDIPIKEISIEKLKKLPARGLRFSSEQWDIVPAFPHRGGLGLYVFQSSGSFKNVVLQPLDTGN
jgi:serine/threonine protein kinase